MAECVVGHPVAGVDLVRLKKVIAKTNVIAHLGNEVLRLADDTCTDVLA